ncbi:MAG: NAD(+)/NADH kinase [Pseudomonadota bacterium]
MRALLVYKKSTYQLYVVERRSARVQDLLQKDDPSVRALHEAHEIHTLALERVSASLGRAGYEVHRTYRARLGRLDGFDLIVPVGGDGTLLDVSHHLRAPIPVLGVNSDPGRSVGMLAGAKVDNLDAMLAQVRAGEVEALGVTRLELRLDGEMQGVLALNDVLVTQRNPAAMSRYLLATGAHEESQMGSGLWVASAVGSTAAIRSAGGVVQPIGEDRLQFRVREPYGVRDNMLLTAGFLAPEQTLRVHSTMREGRIYVDGPHVRFDFPLGCQLQIRAVPRSLHLFLSEAAIARRNALA